MSERSSFEINAVKELRKRSGTIKSKDKLVSFLYELMRDYVPTGTVERCVLNSTGPNSDECTFTNGYLAKYAIDVAKRLSQE
jgi:hypothetical protein